MLKRLSELLRAMRASTTSDMRRIALAWFCSGQWVLVAAWRYLRQASGDDAYERYLEHMADAHPGERVLGRGEYFRVRQNEKWSGITRCC